jgi:hypothetical protein
MRKYITGCLAAMVLVSGAAASAADDVGSFWAFWGDGKAELSGYRLVQPRYGQRRNGVAVMIVVTEDFSDSARVKAEGAHPKSDVFPVLKLNAVRDFQTGIYDYNVMTSAFLAVDARDGEGPLGVAKTSFSSQEWCGHVYQQWLRRGGELRGALHSYFEGEADQTPSLPWRTGGVVEDALPVLVRGLRGALVPPGGTRTVPFLPSSLRARLSHRPQAWGEATIVRDAAARPVKTALGTLPAFTVTVVEKDGDTTRYVVEEAWPHRLLAWESSTGESATITGSARLAYWEMNREGGEQALKQLGLPVAVPGGNAGWPAPSTNGGHGRREGQ